MGASRENANIWWYLFGWYSWQGWRGWRGKRLFRRGFWTNDYIIQDSLLTPFNRLVGCKIFGHRNVKDISDFRDRTEHHCFSCYRFVSGWFNYNCHHCKLRSCWPIEKANQYIECPECGVKQVLKLGDGNADEKQG